MTFPLRSQVEVPTGSVMAALKVRTAEAHAAAERRLDLDRLTSSLDEYARVLETLFGFYAPFDRRVAEAAHSAFRFVPEAKAARIANDLARLGRADLRHVPICGSLPEIATLPRFAGAIYVTEGAALGGRIISRRLKERLAIDATSGASFFDGAGAGTGARWREFGLAVEAAIHEDDLAETVAAARETFAAFEAWLASRDESR